MTQPKKEKTFSVPEEVTKFAGTLFNDFLEETFIFAGQSNFQNHETLSKLKEVLIAKLEGYILNLLKVRKKAINDLIKAEVDLIKSNYDVDEKTRKNLVSQKIKESIERTSVAKLVEDVSRASDTLLAIQGVNFRDEIAEMLNEDRRTRGDGESKVVQKIKKLSIEQIIQNHVDRNARKAKIKYTKEQIETMKNAPLPLPAFKGDNILHKDGDTIYYAVRNINTAQILLEGKDHKGNRRHCIADESQRYSKIINDFDEFGFPKHACFSIRMKKGDGPEIKVFTVWYDRETKTIDQIRGENTRANSGMLTNISSPEGRAVLTFIKKLKEEYADELPVETIKDLQNAVHLDDFYFLVRVGNDWEKMFVNKLEESGKFSDILMGKVFINEAVVSRYGVDFFLRMIDNKNVNIDGFSLAGLAQEDLEIIIQKVLDTSHRKLASLIMQCYYQQFSKKNVAVLGPMSIRQVKSIFHLLSPTQQTSYIKMFLEASYQVNRTVLADQSTTEAKILDFFKKEFLKRPGVLDNILATCRERGAGYSLLFDDSDWEKVFSGALGAVSVRELLSSTGREVLWKLLKHKGGSSFFQILEENYNPGQAFYGVYPPEQFFGELLGVLISCEKETLEDIYLRLCRFLEKMISEYQAQSLGLGKAVHLIYLFDRLETIRFIEEHGESGFLKKLLKVCLLYVGSDNPSGYFGGWVFSQSIGLRAMLSKYCDQELFNVMTYMGERLLDQRASEVSQSDLFIYLNYMYSLAEETQVDESRLSNVLKVISNRNFPHRLHIDGVIYLLDKYVQPKYFDRILEGFVGNRFRFSEVVHSKLLNTYIITGKKKNLLDLILDQTRISDSNGEHPNLEGMVGALGSAFASHFLETVLMFKGREFMFGMFDEWRDKDSERFRNFVSLKRESVDDALRSDLMTDLLREYIAKRALPY